MEYFIKIENRKINLLTHYYVYLDYKVLCILDCSLKKKINHMKPVKTYQVYFNFSSPNTAYNICTSYM